MATNSMATGETPRALGWTMPAEWEPHQATWLAWPHHPTDWPGKLNTIRWVYGEMARKISPGERVRMLINSAAQQKAAQGILGRAGADLGRVEFLPWPTNRGWMRDSGPIFLKRGRAGMAQTELSAELAGTQIVSGAGGWEIGKGTGKDAGATTTTGRDACPTTAIVHFHFNAWARYPDWQEDRRIPERAAELMGCPLFHAQVNGQDFVLEGGSIDVNGRGTVLTTEECLLDPVTQTRNPGLSREEIELALKNFLGVTQVLWLGGGIAGDDTHGHVDDICRFVNPTTVVLCQEKNPQDANYRPLAENRERLQGMRLEDGSKVEVVSLSLPAPLYFDGCRLPASYANFYIANAAVLVPTFNDPNDRVALGILAELFQDRPVVGIHAVDVVLGYGTLHCLTQQEPG